MGQISEFAKSHFEERKKFCLNLKYQKFPAKGCPGNPKKLIGVCEALKSFATI